jgi:hypothetical protein
MTNDIETLTTLWKALFPAYCPPRTQFVLWLDINGAEITQRGIQATGKRYLALGCNMSPEHLTRFASGCMRNMKFRAQYRHAATPTKIGV